MNVLGKTTIFGLIQINGLTIGSKLLLGTESPYLATSQVRHAYQEMFKLPRPKPGTRLQYRRDVHYPEEYTIKPLRTTNLAGRCRITGRVIVKTLGGGIKWPFLWVDHKRLVPKGSPPLIERVLEVMEEPNRSAHVALVGHDDKLRYIIATENMKKGDTILTSSEITRSAVRPNEGDAYPVGSLPIGCVISCLEMLPGMGGFHARGAGTFCTILRKLGERVIIQIPGKREVSVDQECMAVVGRVSNAIHSSIPIGSPNRLRHLGYRPRSGLWQRKTGRHGRKIYPTKPIRDYSVPPPKKPKRYVLTLEDFPHHPPKLIYDL